MSAKPVNVCTVNKSVLDLVPFCSGAPHPSGWSIHCIRCENGRAVVTDGMQIVEVALPDGSPADALFIPRKIAVAAGRHRGRGESYVMSRDDDGISARGNGLELRADAPSGEFPDMDQYWPSADKKAGSVSTDIEAARLAQILRYVARHSASGVATITPLPAHLAAGCVLIEWKDKDGSMGRALLVSRRRAGRDPGRGGPENG